MAGAPISSAMTFQAGTFVWKIPNPVTTLPSADFASADKDLGEASGDVGELGQSGLATGGEVGKKSVRDKMVEMNVKCN